MEQTSVISFLDDRDNKKIFRRRTEGLKLFEGIKKNILEYSQNFIVVVDPMHFEALRIIKENKEIQKKIKGILVKDTCDESIPLQHMLRSFSLSFLSKNMFDCSTEALNRIFYAWSIGSESDLIADVRVVGDKLFVLSCDINSFFVSVDDIPPLKKISQNKLRQFSIGPHGSYIYWKGVDIHLDLESLLLISNPELKAKAKYDEVFGKALQIVRKKHGINQSELGVSDKQVRRYEHGNQRPTYKAYEKIASAFGITVDELLNEVSTEYQRLLEDE